MKKEKKFGKKQVALAVMVLALGAAVWLNMRYSAANGGFDTADSSTKQTASYLGEAQYVNGSEESDGTVETSAKAGGDYFKTARTERNKVRSEAVELIEETLSGAKATDEQKAEALAKLTAISDRMDKEASIEAILKAKGFNNVIAVISDNDINIVVKGEELTGSETVQIQDVATSQSGLSLDKVKIITVK